MNSLSQCNGRIRSSTYCMTLMGSNIYCDKVYKKTLRNISVLILLFEFKSCCYFLKYYTIVRYSIEEVWIGVKCFLEISVLGSLEQFLQSFCRQYKLYVCSAREKPLDRFPDFHLSRYKNNQLGQYRCRRRVGP